MARSEKENPVRNEKKKVTNISKNANESAGVGSTEKSGEAKVITSPNEIFNITPEKQRIIDEFHKMWYPLQGTTTWMGTELQKCPLDLWIYQEILWECKPDLIIECGTFKGGSALFLANLCEIMNHGHVLSIDINQLPTAPVHPRISFLAAGSTTEQCVRVVDGFCSAVRKVMVILDSDHTKQHVLDELHIYSHFVTPQQYLIVEDTNIHGHPCREDLPEGPYEAVRQFLREEDNSERFVNDKMCERFLMTFNPAGYLRRIK